MGSAGHRRRIQGQRRRARRGCLQRRYAHVSPRDAAAAAERALPLSSRAQKHTRGHPRGSGPRGPFRRGASVYDQRRQADDWAAQER